MKIINLLTTLLVLFTIPQINAQISGTVFRDFNGNGIQENTATYNEPFVQGITVTVFPASGTIQSTTTNVNGTYSFSGLTLPVRVEFTGVPTGDYSSSFGAGNNTNVQFYSAGTSTANFGINAPDDYWNNIQQANPYLITPYYTNGTYDGNSGSEPAIVAVSSDQNSMTPIISTIATKNEVGSVWGVGYQSNKNRFFFSAFTKRHVGFGVRGIGGVYIADVSSNIYSISGSLSLQNVISANGVTIDFGSINRNTTIGDDNYLSITKTDPNRDLDAFDKVGKSSMGGIDIDESTNKMYIVNCFQKSIITLDVSGSTSSLNNASPAMLTPITYSYDIASLPGAPICSGSTLRPWAIIVYKGVGYLGVVCDDSSLGYILMFDPNNISNGFQTLLSIDFSYSRGRIWKPWVSTYSNTGLSQTPGIWDLLSYNQPIIASIAFNEDKSLDISIISRWGHQLGNHNYLPLSGSTYLAYAGAYGDLIHACYDPNSQVLNMEGQLNCGENFTIGDHAWNGYGRMNGGTEGEYYDDLSGDGTDENGQGGLAKIMGTYKTYQIVTDPLPMNSTPNNTFFSTSGIHGYDIISGNRNQAIRLQNDNGNVTFGKASGLGDLELNIAPPPIEIGNRVWMDLDSDGVQDPSESPIQGITVELRKSDNTLIATAVTDANGNYYFTNSTGTNTSSRIFNIAMLNAYQTYKVVIPNVSGGNKQFALGTNSLTVANNDVTNNGDLRDSDGTLVGNNAEIAVLTTDLPIAGANNHTFDFGFAPFTCQPLPCGTTTVQKN